MNNLPHSVVISYNDLAKDYFEERDLGTLIDDYLRKTYEHYAYSFEYTTDIVSGTVHIADIFWETED